MHTMLHRWSSKVSLRTKLTGVTVFLIVLSLLVTGFGVMTMLRNYLITDTDRQLRLTLGAVTSDTITNDEQSGATQYVVARFDARGKLLDANQAWYQIAPNVNESDIQQALSNNSSGVTVKNPAGVIELRMAAKPLEDGTLAVLGLPFDNANRLLSQLITLFILFGIIVLVVGVVVTRILVVSAFAPLRQVELTAAAIASGDFGQRLEDTVTNTEVGRLNRSLNRMLNRIDTALSDRARTIDQMRRFISDASHELRTPLVSVRGYAELYRMGALQSTEDVTGAMDRIEREAIRLGTLVSDLLALARLDEAREMHFTPVELLPLAHDAAMDARALAPQRQIRVLNHAEDASAAEVMLVRPKPVADDDALTTSTRILRRANRRRKAAPVDTSTLGNINVDADGVAITPVVMAAEDKIRQLLTNLIGNAIRYTPEGTPIEIATYAVPARGIARLEVIDHGEGIPPQVRDKIFERFWRADSSRTRDTGGSGLGLAIVSSIVGAHQGRIGITATPGGGATFRVELPLLDEQKTVPEVEV